MYEFRVTKYDPSKRNDKGHYQDKNEWTEYSDIGKSVNFKDYERVESAYIDLAIEMIRGSGINALKVMGLEDTQRKSEVGESEEVLLSNIASVLRSLLRGEYWCKLESEQGFVHIGWDYYMYIGVNKVDKTAIRNVENRDLVC